jgi:hypothetical protein
MTDELTAARLDKHSAEIGTVMGMPYDEIEKWLSFHDDDQDRQVAANALAAQWHEDGGEPGFNQPPRSLVDLIEELTGEPVGFGDWNDED